MSTVFRCRKCVDAGRVPPEMATVDAYGGVRVRTGRQGWGTLVGYLTEMGAPRSTAEASLPALRSGVGGLPPERRAQFAPIGGSRRRLIVCPMCGRNAQVTAPMLRKLAARNPDENTL